LNYVVLQVKTSATHIMGIVLLVEAGSGPARNELAPFKQRNFSDPVEKLHLIAFFHFGVIETRI